MISFNKKNIIIVVIALLLIVLCFGFFYFDMVFSLPLFGDAATHGFITKQIINKRVLNVKSSYPPPYNISQGILFSLFGEKGMNSIVFLGILLIAFSIFLLTKELINKKSIALLSVIITLASPKVIFYSARMYMEILISGFFIFSIYLLIKFIKDKSIKNLILLSFFVGITASIKQQGLFILFPAILLFFLVFSIIQYIKNKKKGILNYNPLKRYIFVFVFIFLLITIFPYLALFHNYGKIVPGSEEFRITRGINYIGQKISGYKQPQKNIMFEGKWRERLESIQKEYYPIGTERAERGHIRPLEPLTSWNKFVQANGLYLEKFWGGSTSKELANTMNFLLVFGLIIWVVNLIFQNKLLKFENRKILMLFFVFVLIFLSINYILFARNTDQMRYHLFIPILLSIFSATGLYFLCKLVLERSKSIGSVSIFLILTLLLYSTIVLACKDTTFNKRWYRSQIYSPSKGGIASIAEAGKWLKQHSDENDLTWQTCGNELAYYSERNVVGSAWFYFLNESELKEIFKDQNVKYIVILDSQIVPDEKWENFCWVPQSFEEKIRNLYPQAYKTSFDDIRIYKIR